MFDLIITGAACGLFALAVYARHRMLREERRRPGYLIPRGESGSWYEEYDQDGRKMVRPSKNHPRG